MNIFINILVNLLNFIKQIIYFIEKSSILSSLIVSIIIGLFLFYFFRSPNFEIKMYAKIDSSINGSIFFDIKNNKHLMSYNIDDVFYKIYMPIELAIKEDNFEISTTNGWLSWNPLHNLEYKNHININGLEYIQINGINKLNIFPKQATTLFRVNGNFTNRLKPHKIYYEFRTRYGFYPTIVHTGWKNIFIKKYEGKQKDVSRGVLPYSTLQTDTINMQIVQ